jgi:tetratricopeptide (TPR) repeat protein
MYKKEEGVMKKKVFFIVLLVIIISGYAGYCVLAQHEFSQGQAAFEAKDWLIAQERFERSGGFYKFALPSHTSEALILRDQSSLLLFGQSMRDKGDYPSALEAYTSFIVLYPESKIVSPVKELFPSIYMDWGMSLRGKSNFTGAIEKLEVVIQTYPQTSISDPAKKADAETYRAWGDALVKAEDYKTAVEKYQVLSEKFPTQPAAQGVNEVLSETYLKWADQLRNSKQQELALEMYNFIIANFGGTSVATKASAALAPTMLEWTETLHQDKQFAKEVEILRKLMKDYKDTSEAQQASQEIITAYDSLGQQLINDKSFLSSMQTYNDAKEFALGEEARSVVDAGYNNAIQGLATDTGKDGIQVISEALITACAGQPAASPTVGVLKDTPAKMMACSDSHLSIPTELRPSTPGEFKYAVSIAYSWKFVNFCLYNGGNMLVFERNMAEVTIFNAVTGTEFRHLTLYGSSPEISCPSVYYGNFDPVRGSQVNSDDILTKVREIFQK